MGGGVIREYDSLTYCFVSLDNAFGGEKRWYISPFPKIKVGNRVEVLQGVFLAAGTVLRVECVTAQTAPTPVKRTQEILRITQ